MCLAGSKVTLRRGLTRNEVESDEAGKLAVGKSRVYGGGSYPVGDSLRALVGPDVLISSTLPPVPAKAPHIREHCTRRRLHVRQRRAGGNTTQRSLRRTQCVQDTRSLSSDFIGRLGSRSFGDVPGDGVRKDGGDDVLVVLLRVAGGRGKRECGVVRLMSGIQQESARPRAIRTGGCRPGQPPRTSPGFGCDQRSAGDRTVHCCESVKRR